MPMGFWNWLAAIVTWVGAYLLGSLPIGVWMASAYGRDLRKEGSGNIGATNAWRVLGWKVGLPVFILDVLKGTVPVLLAKAWFEDQSFTISLTAALPAVGHVWSCFLGFRGGKGVSTCLGALLGLNGWVALIALVVWAGVLFVYQYVSLASIVATVAAGFVMGMAGYHGAYIAWALFAALLTLYTHRANLKRLCRSMEPRATVWKR